MRQFLMFSLLMMAIIMPKSDAKCAFQAIFNFGDSNSDTGAFYAAFPSQPSPNGMTYFKRPTGRATDGRLYIDFLAQALGLPFISPYLQSIGSDYSHGANFATLASTVLQPNTSLFVNGVSPFYLGVQLNQMKLFKAKVDEAGGKYNLPSSDIFGKALYTLNIGQNDITGYLDSAGPGGVKENSPQVISQITSTIKELYSLGGRTFLVLNLAPVGCYPRFLAEQSQGGSDVDASGCKVSYNNAVNEYNNMLKYALQQTRKDLSGANVIYVNTNAALLDLYQIPKSHGLQHGITACCGQGGGSYNFNPQVFCGSSKEINGHTVTATACSDPQNYVSWDGVHWTEAANKLMTYAILSGSYNDPPFSLHHYCDIQPIG
ncbi:GDSL esterase/lipase At4g01130-like [Olea europaea var. sylvestris]|uniref:GDSL esterase/lipase At4g01130-like n=1 Tax=Olea europaea var. sylvestris TaxID=158386 RepID=UPI000C1D7A64|nr:GDSL esterase/lipase At4g01130-like [Olea europaea var. sylvestris]